MAENTPEKAPGTFSLLGTASTMGLHMVSGPVVGGGLGWLVDWWLDSWPVGATVGLLLGVAAGFRNVWADARYLQKSNDAIDAERKKQEEKAVEGPSVPKKAMIVPLVHKDDASAVPARNTAVTGMAKQVRAESGPGQGASGSESYVASVFAGVASARERDIEELDETEEAIRRILAGNGEGSAEDDKAARKGD